MKKLKLVIEGMHCSSCAGNIERSLKKVAGVTTKTPNLPPQAIIQDQDTFIDSTHQTFNIGKTRAASAVSLQGGPLAIIAGILIVLFYIFKLLFLRFLQENPRRGA